MNWVGYVGLIALTICWIPQTVETLREGVCEINKYFLMLSIIGSFSLMLYALSIGDPLFSILNSVTTTGALVNFFFKIFPRPKTHD